MPRRRSLSMMGQSYPTTENAGLGQEQPVRQPGAQGAAQQGVAPPIQPLPPMAAMSPMQQAMPGGGDANSMDLMQLLMSLQKGY